MGNIIQLEVSKVRKLKRNEQAMIDLGLTAKPAVGEATYSSLKGNGILVTGVKREQMPGFKHFSQSY